MRNMQPGCGSISFWSGGVFYLAVAVRHDQLHVEETLEMIIKFYLFTCFLCKVTFCALVATN